MDPVEGSGETFIGSAVGVVSGLLDGRGRVVGFIECIVGSFGIKRKGGLSILEETLATGPDFLVDVVNKQRVELVFLLELLCQFIIIVVVV